MPNDYILRSDVEKMIKYKIEETIKYWISTDAAQYFRILWRKLALQELLSELSSLQSVDIENAIWFSYVPEAMKSWFNFNPPSHEETQKY